MPQRPLPRLLTSAARRHLLALGFALGVSCLSGMAQAQQSGPVDPVMRFLAERGITGVNVVESSRSLIHQMRDTTSDMVLSAMNFLGVPYRRGGDNAEDGFDCSGFTRHIFELSLGLVLPHRADEQAKDSALTSVRRDELKPGDLVFFNTMRRTFSHVGIYVGEGKFIHSPNSGAKVRVDDMREAYWRNRFTGARRAKATDTVTATPDAATALR